MRHVSVVVLGLVLACFFVCFSFSSDLASHTVSHHSYIAVVISEHVFFTASGVVGVDSRQPRVTALYVCYIWKLYCLSQRNRCQIGGAK